MSLKLNLNVAEPDGVYAALAAAHEGLTQEESLALNARLVLLLANQIGDRSVILAAIAEAARSR
jgi:Protein of unknown function (DUF2783)